MRRSRPQFLETPSPLPPNLSFVLDISPSAMTLGLGNMRKLTSALGHPERCFRSALVAGTNGKGSVAALLASILQAQGLRVGCYTSPHIYDVSERVRVDGESVTIDEMEAAAARIVPLHADIGFSYFEALTAIAFLIFAERGVEFAVLETGLGGRFDATNVVEPEVSVLTSIGLDHRRILGDTVEEIILEKLGVARGGMPLLTGPIDGSLDAIVQERARRTGIVHKRLSDLGSTEAGPASFDGFSARVTTPVADYGTVPLTFHGVHQLGNLLLAVGAAEAVAGKLAHLDAATARARMHGRFEVHRVGDKRVILDVAHNDDALIATLRTLGALSPRGSNAVVFGLLSRKELVQFPEELHRHAARVHLIEPVPGESFTPAHLAASMGGVAGFRQSACDVHIERRFDDERGWNRFIDRLLDPANPAEVVLVTGSHRTVEQFGLRFRKRLGR
jgi:dihydrofolate synthase/folylpolyglutamate synthase